VGQSPPGSHYVIPESWSCVEFTAAARNMFKEAHSISLSIPTTGVGEPDPNATTYKAENINIRLLVMVDGINGYIADNGYCNFEFEKYLSQGGAEYWRLRKWWDNTNVLADAEPGVEPTSLGRVLALYR